MPRALYSFNFLPSRRGNSAFASMNLRELRDKRDRLEQALDEDGGNQELARQLDEVCAAICDETDRLYNSVEATVQRINGRFFAVTNTATKWAIDDVIAEDMSLTVGDSILIEVKDPQDQFCNVINAVTA